MDWCFPELNSHSELLSFPFLPEPQEAEFPCLRSFRLAPSSLMTRLLLLNYTNHSKGIISWDSSKGRLFSFIPNWVRKIYSFTSQKINLMHVPQEIHARYLFMANATCTLEGICCHMATVTAVWATIHSELVRKARQRPETIAASRPEENCPAPPAFWLLWHHWVNKAAVTELSTIEKKSGRTDIVVTFTLRLRSPLHTSCTLNLSWRN